MNGFYIVDVRGDRYSATRYLADNGIPWTFTREQFGYSTGHIDPSKLARAERLMRAPASRVLAIRKPRMVKVNPSTRRRRNPEAVKIDIDVDSHNQRRSPGAQNEFEAARKSNPRGRRGHHIPAAELRYRERLRRGQVMKPATFQRIEREATRRYHSAKIGKEVAGAAYWRALDKKYRQSQRARRPNPARRYYVQAQQGGAWITLAMFPEAKRATEYAHAVHRRAPGRMHRVIEQ